MPAWKVIFIAVVGLACLGLAFAAFIVPMTDIEHRWLWCVGLLVATAVLGTLFTLFLRSADRALKM